MFVLGIESSCDETAAAVVEFKNGIVYPKSQTLSSQIDIHKAYGGVVPEVAARNHIEVINPLIEQAVAESGLEWSDLDAVGVVNGPGLSGSLLIGTLAARTLAKIKNLPLFGVNHVLAHVYANFIDASDHSTPEFPMLALIISGGHTQLVLFRDHFDYEILGRTHDDAVGEAFDKVAKVLGLSYPGGPAIAAAAEQGDAQKYTFPKPKLENPYDFSFSGLKTAVLRRVQELCGHDYTFPSHKLKQLLKASQVNDLAASFQRVAVEILVDKTNQAVIEHQPKTVVIAGGVAANKELRQQLQDKITEAKLSFVAPELCTDNALMVASLTAFEAQYHRPNSINELKINPNLSM